MSNIVNTYKISDSKHLKIVQDDIAESPREWDNMGTMVCFHRRYNLGDEHDYNSSDYNSFEELKDQIEKDHNVAVILPLYLYDHSGITISTTPFSCSWDSGQVGWIYVTKDEVKENYGVKKMSKKILARVTNYLLADVKTYDQYLTGEVYGFQLVQVSTCDCGHDEEEILDSCWGFFGHDIIENGIIEHLNETDRKIVESQL